MPDIKPGSLPLPGNADNRGSEGIVAKLIGLHVVRFKDTTRYFINRADHSHRDEASTRMVGFRSILAT